MATSFAKTEGVQRMFLVESIVVIFTFSRSYKHLKTAATPSSHLLFCHHQTPQSHTFNFCNHAWEQCIDAMQETQKGSLQKRVSEFSNKLLTCSFLSFANLYFDFSRAIGVLQSSYLQILLHIKMNMTIHNQNTCMFRNIILAANKLSADNTCEKCNRIQMRIWSPWH